MRFIFTIRTDSQSVAGMTGMARVFFLCVLFFKKENGNYSRRFPIRGRLNGSAAVEPIDGSIFPLRFIFRKINGNHSYRFLIRGRQGRKINGNHSHRFPIRGRRGMEYFSFAFYFSKNKRKPFPPIPNPRPARPKNKRKPFPPFPNPRPVGHGVFFLCVLFFEK